MLATETAGHELIKGVLVKPSRILDRIGQLSYDITYHTEGIPHACMICSSRFS